MLRWPPPCLLAHPRGALAPGHRRATLQQLKKHRGRAAFRVEEERRARLVAELQQARLTGVRFKVPAETMSAKLSNLPDGVSVERGRIEVRFDGAEDAQARLYTLAQALGNDLGAEVPGVGGDGAKRLSDGAEEEPVDDGLVLGGDLGDRRGHGEDDLEVLGGQQVRPAPFEPRSAGQRLTGRTVAVAAGVVPDAAMAAAVALLAYSGPNRSLIPVQADHPRRS